VFDFDNHLHELRRRPTEWLTERRELVVREQRRLHVEELALTRVLDERGAFDAGVAAADRMSARAARETLETARALESLPAVAAVAYAGELSGEQLHAVVQLADETSDEEWARRAPDVSPVELARLVRQESKPTAEDGRARREARELRMWWRQDTGMLAVRGELPDFDGALVEAVFDRRTDRMRPAKGRPWDSRAHRMADALVELCRREHDRRQDGGVASPDPVAVRMVVHVPLHGPAEVAGIPLPDAMVEALRAQATIEPVLVDDDGAVLEVGRAQSAISTKIQRAVLLRDGHCRWPGCDRARHLHVHHLIPRTWGGSDEIANLAVVCSHHHPQLVPQGDWILIGNPNRPDGLRLVCVDEWRAEQRQAGSGPPRAGPVA